MKSLAILVGLTAALFAVRTVCAETINFDDAKPGALPAGWTGAQTGAGAAKWSVEQDATAPSKPNVLKQSGAAAYPVCLKNDAGFKEGFVAAKVKIVSGAKNQAGGVIWRAKDSDNYYVCRASVTDNNVVAWKVVAGTRTRLAAIEIKGAAPIKASVPVAEWHTLRVEFSGRRFIVFFNGNRLFEVEDSTFTEAGKVGLWTKDDSVTLFDDFSYGVK